MNAAANDLTVDLPATRPEEIVLPVAWDVNPLKMALEHRLLVAADLPLPHTPVKLADDAKLRREHGGGFVQSVQSTQALNDAGTELLRQFVRGRLVSGVAGRQERDFLALMHATGVLTPARVDEESAAELFWFDQQGHPTTHLHSPSQWNSRSPTSATGGARIAPMEVAPVR